MRKRKRNSFEDWHDAAREYANKHLDLWDFQIKMMASDFAWHMEGADITDESLHEAYEDWISGNNPYCFAHSITLDGYDQQGQREHDDRRVTREFTEFLEARGVIDTAPIVEYAKSVSGSIGIFGDDEEYEKWFTGWNKLKCTSEKF